MSARTLFYPYSFRSHLLASSISRNKKKSEYVRAVQNGSTFEITVRGVLVAMLTPIANPASKPDFQARVLDLLATPSAPKLDVMAALQVARK